MMVFDKWYVIEQTNDKYWKCLCLLDWTVKIVSVWDLKSGRSRHCGCKRRKLGRK
jgi:hypothetical protein